MIDVEHVIRTHGFMVQSVFASPTTPAFCYTIGLNDRLPPFPELIIIGLNPKLSYHFIHWVVNHYDETRTVPEPGQILTEVANHPMKIGMVSDTNIVEWLCQAVYRAKRRDTLPVHALQLIWTDENGLFPDEPGFNSAFHKIQPLLA